MKVTPAHLAVLRDALAPLDTPEFRTMYARGKYPRADLTRDVNRRYRFDLLYVGIRHSEMGDALRYVLAAGDYKDEHLHTAIKSFVPDIKPTD